MATPLRNKVYLWRSRDRGVKSRITKAVSRPAVKRDKVPDVLTTTKLKRGDTTQKLRLKHYPSIDVDFDLLYAGEIEGDLDTAEDLLIEMGFRNNPTAYVEVTDQYGPDDGSYSKQYIEEDAGRIELPHITGQPALWRRLKQQIHVTVFQINSTVAFLAHKETSAWLQPARHVWNNEVSARVGVRDFRDEWYDEFERELPGKEKVIWDTTN